MPPKNEACSEHIKRKGWSSFSFKSTRNGIDSQLCRSNSKGLSGMSKEVKVSAFPQPREWAKATSTHLHFPWKMGIPHLLFPADSTGTFLALTTPERFSCLNNSEPNTRQPLCLKRPLWYMQELKFPLNSKAKTPILSAGNQHWSELTEKHNFEKREKLLGTSLIQEPLSEGLGAPKGVSCFQFGCASKSHHFLGIIHKNFISPSQWRFGGAQDLTLHRPFCGQHLWY